MEQSWSPLFESQPTTLEDQEKIAAVRAAFGKLAETLQTSLPAGRYKSLVLTNLETSALFAIKAISHGGL